jgi:cytochrome c-type biogenesis protein CcmE
MTLRQKRMIFTFLVISCAVIVTTLVILALKENVNLFFTPTQLVTQTEKFSDRPNLKIRVGGMIKKDSVLRDNNLNVKFIITDFQNNIMVEYKGILPDLFREGQGVVVQGRWLKQDIFKADEVLAKHDENYMPKGMNMSKTKNDQSNSIDSKLKEGDKPF